MVPPRDTVSTLERIGSLLGKAWRMITISHGPCQVTLSPERGAIVTSLKIDGVETLYLDQATFDDPSKNVRGGVPVLFPIVGPVRDGEYEWEGKRYRMAQHGFARTEVWTVLEQTEDRAVLELLDSATTREQFPFPFRYRLTYSAVPDGLRIEQTIENRGEEAMPAQFGFHPYFQVGAKTGLEFSLPVSTYADNKSDASGPFHGFDFSRDEIDWAFPQPTAPSASFEDSERGLRVTVDYGPEYGWLVFWTLQGSPFVCLEPWSSARLGFPQGADVHRIPSGATLNSTVALRVERL